MSGPNVSVRLGSDLKEKAEGFIARSGGVMTMSDLVRDALQSYLCEGVGAGERSDKARMCIIKGELKAITEAVGRINGNLSGV